MSKKLTPDQRQGLQAKISLILDAPDAPDDKPKQEVPVTCPYCQKMSVKPGGQLVVENMANCEALALETWSCWMCGEVFYAKKGEPQHE